MLNRIIALLTVLFITLFLTRPIAFGQEPLTDAEKQATIDSLSRLLEENYVFPDVARQMSEKLKQKLKAGAYADLPSAPVFADQLTDDLQSVSHDKHLRVRFDPRFNQNMRNDDGSRDGPDEESLTSIRRSNYGFQEMKILEGNVGYLDLRGFMDPSLAGETATAAMNFLSGADAIIFDLRQNGGGSPQMIQLLTSYLYDEHANVHLNSFYHRPTNDTSQTWTLPYVPGRRNPDAEVFVLTSNYTFSAAEEFTYNLKNLERGTIVGETTGGGAHPGGMMPVAGRFVCFIPSGRAINPVTKTNWEGTGVEPDVKINSEKALDKAHLLALEKLAEKAEKENDKRYYQWFGASLQARLEPVVVAPDLLQQYAGTYGHRALLFEDGQLYYQRSGRSKLPLVAIEDHTFSPKDNPGFRLRVEMAENQAVALVAEGVDGFRERLEKSDPGKATP